jgi:hypothetical protein
MKRGSGGTAPWILNIGTILAPAIIDFGNRITKF